ncbi:MAG: hypothetical protein QXD32_00670 [Nitrososphaerota archaeon]
MFGLEVEHLRARVEDLEKLQDMMRALESKVTLKGGRRRLKIAGEFERIRQLLGDFGFDCGSS